MRKTRPYLAMRTDYEDEAIQLINSDLRDLGHAATNLATVYFICVLYFSYLLILDRTNWKTNILTSLLIPYIFLSLPPVIFSAFRGEFGKWIAFIAVVLRLFFPRHFPDWLELPAALILLIVVAPSLFASTFRSDWVGVTICLLIACYLLQEHIRASGGFRNSFTKAHGISNTIGIILLLVFPVWTLVQYIL
ncbi:cold-regulated 413 plasma membrane protein 1 [Senna tora]|uniref:Cold-regulated 413 plasma membrane protein 1 n=1 Tax=Senna tora TaxID=362788 RepID=A0A834W691_9FABA|nr:cold-regulated 413 plasma membrane protein 1 [Senna tora]